MNRIGLYLSLVSLSACGAKDPAGETDEPADPTVDTEEPSDTDVEAPSACAVLVPYAGTYLVTGPPTGDEQRGEPTGAHVRGTVVIGADCAIDYDDGITFGADEITAVYDRTEQDFDRRVQVSYGADDNGPVVNVYLTDDLAVYEIQYRHNDDGTNLRVLVEPE